MINLHQKIGTISLLLFLAYCNCILEEILLVNNIIFVNGITIIIHKSYINLISPILNYETY